MQIQKIKIGDNLHLTESAKIKSFSACDFAFQYKCFRMMRSADCIEPIPSFLSVCPRNFLNKHETDFIYQEIFEQNEYLKHGIILKEGDCVFDIGANIGMFSLSQTQP